VPVNVSKSRAVVRLYFRISSRLYLVSRNVCCQVLARDGPLVGG
jgi:hypothetical protein